MTTDGLVHHADVVGSLLRPRELVDARAAMRQGQLPYPEYRHIEDQAVDAALRLQEEAGLHVVTDGEMRRDIYFDFFVAGMDGLAMLPGATVKFHGHDPSADFEVQIPFSVTERVTAKDCPGVAEFQYASERTDRRVKVTLPSPLIMICNFWNEHSQEAYPDPFELAIDARDAVVDWMRQLADVGCTYLQIDAPELATAFTDKTFRTQTLPGLGLDPDRFIEVGTEIIGTLGDVDLPGVTKALHVCKGNGTRSWIGEGGYEAYAEHVLASATGYDVFHLEYDDERSGGFEPLAQLPDEKVAVLGLVSTKWTRMEAPEELKARIDDAAKFHPKERLALATQCGFASGAETAEDRKITDQTQTDKLRLVVDVARDVWG